MSENQPLVIYFEEKTTLLSFMFSSLDHSMQVSLFLAHNYCKNFVTRQLIFPPLNHSEYFVHFTTHDYGLC